MSKFRQQHMPVMWHDMTHDDSDVPSKDSPLKEPCGMIQRDCILMTTRPMSM